MNFLIAFILPSLVYSSCPERLHEAIKREFGVFECSSCLILLPRTDLGSGRLAGFCDRNQLHLFFDWKCEQGINLTHVCNPFLVVTNELCVFSIKVNDLNMNCFWMFQYDMCNRRTGAENQTKRDGTHFPVGGKTEDASFDRKLISTTETFAVMNKIFTERAKGGIKEKSLAKKELNTEIGTTANTEKTVGSSSSTINTTEIMPAFCAEREKRNFLSVIERRNCEINEYFFNDHCYFLKPFYIDFNQRNRVPSSPPNATKVCQMQHPKALGLAVETKEENEFIMHLLSRNPVANFITFTSGIREKGSRDKWSGWDIPIDESVLTFREGGWSTEPDVHYCIDVCNRSWYMLNDELLKDKTYVYVVCERLYNPRNIHLVLHEHCLQEYRNSHCYKTNEHVDYCCVKDETGDIWFSCPNRMQFKEFKDVSCSWYCGDQGLFTAIEPSCRGLENCAGSYRNINYFAPFTRYAIGGCPKGFTGNSLWYCTASGKFLGKPDFSFCCKGENSDRISTCVNVDPFLNVWRGCSYEKVVKRTICPPGMILDKALVEWDCGRERFETSTPDYSNCNVSKAIKCRQKDKFGTEWMAETETTIKKNCPPNFTGLCFWYCKESGMFDGNEPDCSRCVADWMNDVTDKIKNQTNYENVMEIMQNYTENSDLTIGYAHVLNLTDNCVNLFKHQVSDCKLSVFDKFLKGYSKILKNVAGNRNMWSNFSVLSRRNYSEQILKTTQTAAFINLEIGNETGLKYNETFAKANTDGFDFFVAYNPSVGSRFPLENSSKSDWHLDIKKINESNSNFAAMGLVMSYELSSLMFPQGNQTQELAMNAPAITFKVAASVNGEVVADPNVVVSVSFKHKNRTRMPETIVIRRRLHNGEHPSGVFNSTQCFYYRDSDWTTEGCHVTFTSKEWTNCTCNHLSTIGLLMSIHKYEPNVTLEIVSTVSSGITIISLILALLVFYFFDKAGNERLLIGKNLCFCLLLGHVMLVTVLDKKFFNIPDSICTVFAILLHYVFMAAFAWMFVEGCHLYRMLVVVFDSTIEYRIIYLLIGYGMPFVVVGITQVVGLIVQEQPYGQDEVCWLKSPMYIWAFVGPVIVLTSINFCILVIAMKLAIASKRKTEKSNFATFMLWVKAWVSLSALLGITWLFGLAYFNYNEPLVYVFVFFNGLQGFFIFLFRCALCEQYKTAFWKKIKSLFWKSKSESHKKTETAKLDTKIYAISGSKSQTESRDSGYDPGFEDCHSCSDEVKKFSERETKISRKSKKSSSRVDADVNVTLTPAVSEAYLRNKMIARNFSVRKSKATLLAESDNFPELSYHYISNGD